MNLGGSAKAPGFDCRRCEPEIVQLEAGCEKQMKCENHSRSEASEEEKKKEKQKRKDVTQAKPAKLQ